MRTLFFITLCILMFSSPLHAGDENMKADKPDMNLRKTLVVDVNFDKSFRESVFKSTLSNDETFDPELFFFLMGDIKNSKEASND